ncbi:16S rRNA (uracil(1498)-N(3))-methyltransferase [bacterium]|nr:16S rRNA (uracil(1498)-N(3))-methyltransferase [candidate division CSSED10-310 bacterium]
MTAERFYFDTLDKICATVTMSGDEARHIIKVVRKTAGEKIELLNGRGIIRTGVISSISRDTLDIRLESIREFAKPEKALHLLCGLPKSEQSFDAILKGSAELGVRSIHPLTTCRSKQYREPFISKRLQRWEKIIISACKQSGNPWFPIIERPADLIGFVDRLTTSHALKFVGWEPGLQTSKRLHQLPELCTDDFYWCVGPEGGWTLKEAQYLLNKGFIPLMLGDLTMTTVTACLTGIVALRAHYQLI